MNDIDDDFITVPDGEPIKPMDYISETSQITPEQIALLQQARQGLLTSTGLK